jgi:hypothetical protein
MANSRRLRRVNQRPNPAKIRTKHIRAVIVGICHTIWYLAQNTLVAKSTPEISSKAPRAQSMAKMHPIVNGLAPGTLRRCQLYHPRNTIKTIVIKAGHRLTLEAYDQIINNPFLHKSLPILRSLSRLINSPKVWDRLGDLQKMRLSKVYNSEEFPVHWLKIFDDEK